MIKMLWKASIGRLSYVKKATCLKQEPGEQNPCILAQCQSSWISTNLLHELDFSLGVERTTHNEVDCDGELSMFVFAGSCAMNCIQCILY